jgi:hypothetical protein
MRLSQIGLRPVGWMIGMGMVESDDLFVAFPCLPLNSNELLGIDVLPVLGRVRARIAAANNRGHNSHLVFELAQQHTAALVRVRLFAMLAD